MSEKKASHLYEAFHRYKPRKIGEFHPNFSIPEHVNEQGRAIDVLYRSSKVDPETLKKPRKPVDYIHEHDPGVKTYLVLGHGEPVPNPGVAGEPIATPAWIRDVDALVLIGKCLGFKFENQNGSIVDAQGKSPLPELYATPDGKALLVVDNKRTLIALIWGGGLNVEPRGIVG